MMVYRCADGDPQWGAASRDYAPGEVVDLARSGRVAAGPPDVSTPTHDRAARDEARVLLHDATDTAARALQAKGYTILTRQVTAYQAGGDGPESAVEFVVTNPNTGNSAQFVATVSTTARLAEVAANTPHAALAVVLPGRG